VLVRMHADVLPHLVSPLLLTDFLTDALDRGGLNGAAQRRAKLGQGPSMPWQH
jgi:hypothetical protein